MGNCIKTTIDFKSVKGIDRIIGVWAKEAGLKECETSFRLNTEDAAYCFSWDNGGEKVFLAIGILDDLVHLEAFLVKGIKGECLPKKKINCLLESLGQKTI